MTALMLAAAKGHEDVVEHKRQGLLTGGYAFRVKLGDGCQPKKAKNIRKKNA
jgi:hypothetical protein